jgi:hypothetical protein
MCALPSADLGDSYFSRKNSWVTWHDDLVPVRWSAQPGLKIDDGSRTSRKGRDVPSVNQDVSIGNVDFTVQLVSVRQDNQRQFGSPTGWEF